MQSGDGLAIGLRERESVYVCVRGGGMRSRRQCILLLSFFLMMMMMKE